MSRFEGVAVAVGGGQARVVQGVVGVSRETVVVVREGSVVVKLGMHELQSVVRVEVVEVSVGVCGKNWTASRGQMSVGHLVELSAPGWP